MQTESKIVTEVQRYKRAAPAKKARTCSVPPGAVNTIGDTPFRDLPQVEAIFTYVEEHYIAQIKRIGEQCDRGQLSQFQGATEALRVSRKFDNIRKMLETALNRAECYLDGE